MDLLVPEGSDFRLQHPFTCMISGPSGSGKTSLLVNLLKNNSLSISRQFDRVVYCYGEEIPETFTELIEAGIKLEIIRGLPDEDLEFDRRLVNCLILDDLMQECSESKTICDYFTKTSHHKSVSVFLLTQNLYHQGKYQITIKLNTNYVIVFKS